MIMPVIPPTDNPTFTLVVRGPGDPAKPATDRMRQSATDGTGPPAMCVIRITRAAPDHQPLGDIQIAGRGGELRAADVAVAARTFVQFYPNLAAGGGITATAPGGVAVTLPPEEVAALRRAGGAPLGHRPGGRPQGRRTIPPLPAGENGIMLTPSGLPVQLYFEAIQAGATADGWTANGEGHPEYRKGEKKIAGAVTYEALDTAIDAALRDVWGDVAELCAADLQLFMCVSNALLLHPNPTAGILIDARRYAEARGVAPQETKAERRAFNDSVRRISSLSMRADVVQTVKRGKREIKSIRGRMVIPEVVATTEVGWVTDPKREPITQEVTGWRLIPGAAWLACRELGHLGRYPSALLAMNPHKEDFLIRLGAFLGYQTAVRAAQGTFAQPLSVRAILAGMHEPIPENRRRLQELRDRFANGMDKLCERGIVTSWQWDGNEPTPAAFPGALIQFIYQREALDDYSRFYPKAKWAMAQPEVRQLMPDGGAVRRRKPMKHRTETHVAPDGNPCSGGHSRFKIGP